MDTLTETAPSKPKAQQTMLIDTDVHELFRSVADLAPYLDPHWARYLRNEGGRWSGMPTNTWYAMPVGRNASRSNWNLEDGTVANNPVVAGKHLFDELGITTAILNGSFHISRLEHDYEFARALASAYNDWQIDKWLSSDKRYRGSVHVVVEDPVLAAKEIDRVGQHPQIVQVFLPTVENRQYGDPKYRPIYEAALRNDLVVTLHHAGHTQTVLGYPRYFSEWHTIAAPHSNQAQLVSFLFNGTFDAYPDLKLVILEAGAAWLPWLMGRADQQYKELRSNTPWVKRLPSEHIRSNVRLSTQPLTDITPKEFTRIMQDWNLEDVYMFSSDYPHWEWDPLESTCRHASLSIL